MYTDFMQFSGVDLRKAMDALGMKSGDQQTFRYGIRNSTFLK